MLPSWFRFSHEILQDLSEMQVPSEILCSECFNGFLAPLRQSLNPLMKLKGLFANSPLSAPAPHLSLLLHVHMSAFPICLMVPDALSSFCLEVFVCRCFRPCSESSAHFLLLVVPLGHAYIVRHHKPCVWHVYTHTHTHTHTHTFVV